MVQIELDIKPNTGFDEAKIGMDISDAEGRILKVNRAFCKILGYSEAEIIEAMRQG